MDRRTLTACSDELNVVCNALRQLEKFLPLSRDEAKDLVEVKGTELVASGRLDLVLDLITYDGAAQEFMGESPSMRGEDNALTILTCPESDSVITGWIWWVFVAKSLGLGQSGLTLFSSGSVTDFVSSL